MNAGVKYDDETEGRFWSGTLGAGVSKGLTDRLKILTEVVALQITNKRYGGNVVLADIGITYLVTRTLEIDALVARGLTSESPHYVVTMGVSARF